MLYRLLNQDAKAWWHHKDLRKAGRHEEARKKERESIRSTVQSLRSAQYLGIGRGGWNLHCGPMTVSHYGGIEQATCQACLRLGIPIVDTTSVPDEIVWELVKLPMVARGEPDPEPWGSMSYAPLSYYAHKARGLGATIYNESNIEGF